jgi:hypothetical protein
VRIVTKWRCKHFESSREKVLGNLYFYLSNLASSEARAKGGDSAVRHHQHSLKELVTHITSRRKKQISKKDPFIPILASKSEEHQFHRTNHQ